MRFNEILWFLDKAETLPAFVLESAGITCRDSTYHISRPHGVDFYTIEYIVSGRGTLRFEDAVYHPAAGDAWLLPPFIPVEYWSDTKDPLEKMWINVAGELPESLVTIYQLQMAVLFHHCPLEDEFKNLLDIVRLKQPGVASDFALGLHKIITRLAAHRNRAGEHRANEAAVTLKYYLESHWREPVRLKDLAALIHRSPVTTLRIFSGEYGCTPGQWLQQHRFEFAKQYLVNTNYTLKSIAELIGFKDEFYFANWFKQRSGCAPGLFRHGTHSTTADDF